MTDKTQLNDKQKAILDLIYSDGLPIGMVARINAVKEAAGYSSTTSAYQIIKTLKAEIVEKNLEFMALYSSDAINRLKEVIETPTTLGADNIIKAANSLLDRAGFGKKETQEIEVKADKGIVILPTKKIE